ncbi:MAG: hypothetical protein ABI702_19385 [Burkholderiales bacterium]
MPLPRFQTGQVVATPGALRMLERAGVSAMTLLARHAFGDFGDLCEEDCEANEQAVARGGRVFSSHEVGVGLNATKVWVITEADRSSTCCLLPEEY